MRTPPGTSDPLTRPRLCQSIPHRPSSPFGAWSGGGDDRGPRRRSRTGRHAPQIASQVRRSAGERATRSHCWPPR